MRAIGAAVKQVPTRHRLLLGDAAASAACPARSPACGTSPAEFRASAARRRERRSARHARNAGAAGFRAVAARRREHRSARGARNARSRLVDQLLQLRRPAPAEAPRVPREPRPRHVGDAHERALRPRPVDLRDDRRPDEARGRVLRRRRLAADAHHRAHGSGDRRAGAPEQDHRPVAGDVGAGGVDHLRQHPARPLARVSSPARPAPTARPAAGRRRAGSAPTRRRGRAPAGGGRRGRRGAAGRRGGCLRGSGRRRSRAATRRRSASSARRARRRTAARSARPRAPRRTRRVAGRPDPGAPRTGRAGRLRGPPAGASGRRAGGRRRSCGGGRGRGERRGPARASPVLLERHGGCGRGERRGQGLRRGGAERSGAGDGGGHGDQRSRGLRRGGMERSGAGDGAGMAINVAADSAVAGWSGAVPAGAAMSRLNGWGEMVRGGASEYQDLTTHGGRRAQRSESSVRCIEERGHFDLELCREPPDQMPADALWKRVEPQQRHPS